MNHEALTTWLAAFVADQLDIDPSEVDIRAPWSEIGVDSAAALVLSADLSAALGVPVRPAEILEHPSPARLAAHLTLEVPA